MQLGQPAFQGSFGVWSEDLEAVGLMSVFRFKVPGRDRPARRGTGA